MSLLLIPNSYYYNEALNYLKKKILTEGEFYQKNETENFIYFKNFLKNEKFILEPNIRQSLYFIKSLEIKNKIISDLNNNRIKYDIINNLIDKKNTLKYKISVIGGEETDKILNKLKENLKICQKKFEDLKLIADYYNSFFSNSKKEIINILKKELQEYKNRNIDDILGCKNIIKDNNIEFNLEKAIEESKKINDKLPIFKCNVCNKNLSGDLKEQYINCDKCNGNICNECNKTHLKEFPTHILQLIKYITIFDTDYLKYINKSNDKMNVLEEKVIEKSKISNIKNEEINNKINQLENEIITLNNK